MDLDDDELEATRNMPCNRHLIDFLTYKKEKQEMKKPKTSKVTLGTTYDLNKSLVKQYEKELTEEQLEEKLNTFEDYITTSDNQYYMLLCNDKKDYTLFNYSTERLTFFWSELLDCLNNRGKIYSIEKTKDNQAIEIWLVINDEAFCYYFFAYDNGVLDI